MVIHEDDRRTLESFPEAKIIRAKKDTKIGEHYHKLKTEYFVLVEGKCSLNGSEMRIGEIVKIAPGIFHVFDINKNSVLIGICDKTYDSTDDYKK